jgi:hypothetical protein
MALLLVCACRFDPGGVGNTQGDGPLPVADLPGPTHDAPLVPTDGPRPEAGPDLGPPPDLGPLPDGLAPDLMPPPDQKLPDLPPPPDQKLVPPDTVLVYVNEPFTSGPGALQPKRGNWSTGNGSYNQSSVVGNGDYAVAPVPVNDYAVETVVTIHDISAQGGICEGAGVAARLQPPLAVAPPGAPVGQYACVVFPDCNYLALVEADGTDPYYYSLTYTSVTINYNTPYRLRLTVVGPVLTCELPDQGQVVSTSDSSHPSGPAALTTLFANASFDYMQVTPP